MTDTPPIVRDLRSFAEAYPEDVFRPLTDADRKEHSVLITRASAQMGRHFGKWTKVEQAALDQQNGQKRTHFVAHAATKAADTIEALLEALEDTEAHLSVYSEGRCPNGDLSRIYSNERVTSLLAKITAAIAKARGQS
jgi:hypothetical protein